jgi:spore coat polysaccharide biosynthesis protein SpsF
MQDGVIIQVRMDSSRFPNKATAIIANHPLLWHVIQRSKKLKIPVIVATTKRDLDDPIVEISKKLNVKVFRGSTDDLLDRYYQCAKQFEMKNIFRITADSPFIDFKQSSKVITEMHSKKYDYVKMGTSYPVGTGIEGFTFKALKKAHENSKNSFEREHVTVFFKNPKNKFRIKILESIFQIKNKHWTIENPKDIKFVRQIFSSLNKEFFYTDEIFMLLKINPSLNKFNSLD